MKRLISNIAICFGMMAATLGIVWIIPGTHSHDLATLINKDEILLSKKPPRLIFIAGSSVLSLDSSRLERELGIPVVNLGLWGGLNVEQYLNDIEDKFMPGDIIAITQEYGISLDPEFQKYIYENEESKRFLFLLSPRKHIKMYLMQRDYILILKYVVELSQIKVRTLIRNVLTINYSIICKNGLPDYKYDFNEHGDRRHPFLTIRPLNSTGKKYKFIVSKNQIYFNDIYRRLSKRGIKMFFYFSHLPVEEFNLNRKYIDQYYEMMKKKLELPIINRPEDFALPRSCFADTIYHLNPDGEKMRTDKMILLMKMAIAK
jgi:hypothetical protein